MTARDQPERTNRPLAVSKRLGHSAFSTTHDMYGHLIPPLRDANLEAFEQLIVAAVDM